MKSAIDLARKISKQLDKNWMQEIESVNLHKVFESIYRLEYNIVTLNTLFCAIVFGYDSESGWIDLKHDGFTINKNILIGLGADITEPIFEDFIKLRSDDILNSIGSYLDLLPDWKYVTARKQIDFHARYVRETESFSADIDEDKKIKARENIGRLIREAISQRKAADELLELIRKENVLTTHKVQSDFGVDYTQKTMEFMDEEKVDIMSWRDWIKVTLPKLKEKQKSATN